jgi:hypothetical protein
MAAERRQLSLNVAGVRRLALVSAWTGAKERKKEERNGVKNLKENCWRRHQ